MLRAAYNGSCWEFESEIEEWDVAGAWAFPCHIYRKVLSVFVKKDWQLTGAKFKWRPELTPYTFSLSFDDTELVFVGMKRLVL